MKCLKCGCEISDDSLFCVNCGAKQVTENVNSEKVETKNENVNLEKGKEIARNVINLVTNKLKNPDYGYSNDKLTIYGTLVVEILAVMGGLYLPLASLLSKITGYDMFDFEFKLFELISASLMLYFGLFLLKYVLKKFVEHNARSVVEELFVYVNDFIIPAAFMLVSAIVGLVSLKLGAILISVVITYLSVVALEGVQVKEYYKSTILKIIVFVVVMGSLFMIFSNVAKAFDFEATYIFDNLIDFFAGGN